MKRVSLDHEKKPIRDFVSSLTADAEDSILEVAGEAIARVTPITGPSVDLAKLKEAILNRRDASRELNEEWQQVDGETWEKSRG